MATDSTPTDTTTQPTTDSASSPQSAPLFPPLGSTQIYQIYAQYAGQSDSRYMLYGTYLDLPSAQAARLIIYGPPTSSYIYQVPVYDRTAG